MRSEKQAQLIKNDHLLQACRDGCLKTVQTAIDDGGELDHAGGVFGETPLHAACGKGSLPVVQALIEAGADVRARCERNGTPLHEAAFGNHIPVVKWMVANTNCRLLAKNTNGMTPERSAKSQRHHKCAELLKKAAETRKSLSPQRSAPSQSPVKSEPPKPDIELLTTADSFLKSLSPAICTWSDLHRQYSIISKVIPLLEKAVSIAPNSESGCSRNALLAAMFNMSEEEVRRVFEKENTEETKEEREGLPPEPSDNKTENIIDNKEEQHIDPVDEPEIAVATPDVVLEQTEVVEKVRDDVETEVQPAGDETPQQEPPSPAPVPPAPPTLPSPPSPQSMDESITKPESQSQSQSQPEPQTDTAEEAEWECLHCHFENSPSDNECSICCEPKGSPAD